MIYTGCFGINLLSLCRIYRMSIKSFPDFTNIYCKKTTWNKNIFFTVTEISKILCHVFIVTFGFWMQHFQTGGLGEIVRHAGHHDRRISPPLTSFYGGMLRT